jgi:hypothetical protein
LAHPTLPPLLFLPFFFPAQKLFKSALTPRLPSFPFLPRPRRPRRKDIFTDFIPEDKGSVARTVYLVFKALSDRVVDVLGTPDELPVEGPSSKMIYLFEFFLLPAQHPPRPHRNSLPPCFRRDTQSPERKLFTGLLCVMQDIICVHTEASSAVLSDWGRLLPELLKAVLREGMPALCLCELTTTIGVLTNTRGEALRANITTFTNLLMTNDVNTTNSTVLKNDNYSGMPSTLAAFSGVLDT